MRNVKLQTRTQEVSMPIPVRLVFRAVLGGFPLPQFRPTRNADRTVVNASSSDNQIGSRKTADAENAANTGIGQVRLAPLERRRYPIWTKADDCRVDADAHGRINSSKLVKYLEIERASIRSLIGLPDSYMSAVVHIEVDCIAELSYFPVLEIGSAISRISKDSVEFSQIVVNGKELLAEAKTLCVYLDKLSGWKKVDIDPSLRHNLGRYAFQSAPYDLGQT
jgi:acyl-CoA thioesterase FadM